LPPEPFGPNKTTLDREILERFRFREKSFKARAMRARLATLSSPDAARTIRQFVQFGAVGLSGFVVDVAVVYGLRHSIGLVGAGLVAYLAAATSNWALNRAWTFREAGRDRPFRQWLLFLAANALGFVLNRGTYLVLIALVPLCREQPVFAVAAGMAAGMLANFNLSRRLVFR
jgi:putative flippase GtrA